MFVVRNATRRLNTTTGTPFELCLIYVIPVRTTPKAILALKVLHYLCDATCLGERIELSGVVCMASYELSDCLEFVKFICHMAG